MKNEERHWRQCVFCGKKPDRKNLEHVIPKWLQALAGNQNKPAEVWTPDGDRNLLWANFTLPSCTSCNQHYGRLEELIKEVFERLEEGYLLGADARLLLDWMDKIRVGLWRLQLAHGKAGHDITPNFSINERLATSDRLVRVFKYQTKGKGIGLVGTDTTAWIRMPSAMALIVKDIVILSASAGGFLQEAMGIVEAADTVNVEGFNTPFIVARPTGDFKPSWAVDLLRFRQQRFFTFYTLGEHFHHPIGEVCTDIEKSVELVDGEKRFELDTVKTLPQLLELLVTIEVLELQRHLLRGYTKLTLPDEFRPRLRNMYQALDHRIDGLTDVYNSIAPIPTYKRSYLSWA
ncbi:hypothetical protein [Ruegeria sp. HKCCA5014]|uniref:hypothetical protein n=1 Tax=Ruegeria sp. HKCCA5014 TaxID=2682980 RepID=UPI0014886D59|nr:hypothetical protein [Ruegeria sp. HKCCA5014]